MTKKLTATLPDGTIATRRSDRPYAFVVAISGRSAEEVRDYYLANARQAEGTAAQWRAVELSPAEPALTSYGRPMEGLMVRGRTAIGYSVRGFGATAEEALADAQKSVAGMIAREEAAAAGYLASAEAAEAEGWSVIRWSRSEELARKAAASKDFLWVARHGRELRVLPVDEA